jgi:prepilin-type N-terminal cleavage/methylation domain-containing protein
MNMRFHPYRPMRAFTLIEIMLVIGILAIVMAMAVPPIYRGLSKEPMRRTIVGLQDAFLDARGAAIIDGKTTAVVFHPGDGTFGLEGAKARKRPGGEQGGKIPEEIMVEMIEINLMSFMEANAAKVRFFPDGTCDEFTLVLHSTKGEWRKVTLEPTTCIMSVGDVR